MFLRAATLAVLLGALLAPVVAHAADVWLTSPEYSFGFLVPPISVALIWLRRERLRHSVTQGDPRGLLLVGLSVGVIVLAQRLGVHALAGIAASPLLWGVAIALFGWQVARQVAFPVWFLAIALGAYTGIVHPIAFALQSFTASASAAAANLVGLPIIREGLVLRGGAFAFVVAEACSGMNSLLSLLALTAVWIYLGHGRATKQALLIASVLPLVAAANTLRVLLVLEIAQQFGQDVASGFFHELSSLVLFGAALAGLLLVSRLVGWRTLPVTTSSS